MIKSDIDSPDLVPAPSLESTQSEDHSDIDRAIQQARSRERAVTRAHNALASKRYAISWAIVILAFGGLLLLGGIGWRIADLSETWWDGRSLFMNDAQKDIQKGQSLVEDVESELESSDRLTEATVKSFTIFVTSQSGLTSSPEITTGIEYDNSASMKPNAQWCYLEKGMGSGLRDLFEGITWTPAGGHKTRLVTKNIAEKFNSTVEEIQDAFVNCAFVEPASLSEAEILRLMRNASIAELSDPLSQPRVALSGYEEGWCADGENAFQTLLSTCRSEDGNFFQHFSEAIAHNEKDFTPSHNDFGWCVVNEMNPLWTSQKICSRMNGHWETSELEAEKVTKSRDVSTGHLSHEYWCANQSGFWKVFYKRCPSGTGQFTNIADARRYHLRVS